MIKESVVKGQSKSCQSRNTGKIQLVGHKHMIMTLREVKNDGRDTVLMAAFGSLGCAGYNRLSHSRM